MRGAACNPPSLPQAEPPEPPRVRQQSWTHAHFAHPQKPTTLTSPRGAGRAPTTHLRPLPSFSLGGLARRPNRPTARLCPPSPHAPRGKASLRSPHACASKAGRTLILPTPRNPPPSPPRGGPTALQPPIRGLCPASPLGGSRANPTVQPRAYAPQAPTLREAKPRSARPTRAPAKLDARSSCPPPSQPAVA
jgi:hypothetical protein